MRVLIAGAGIGGLTAALALRQAGLDVQVYEQASVLREVGAGVLIGPNAVKPLHRLGLADALQAVGVIPRSRDSRDWQSGGLLGRVPLGDTEAPRWGMHAYHLHRADLHDALRSALGDQHITLGARCMSVEQHGSEVTMGFADGRHATGDLLIGADGIHSVVRQHVAGPDQPIWSNLIAWRGLAPEAVGHEVGLEVRHHAFYGPDTMLIAYYVSSGRLVNWVGFTRSDDDWREESWSSRGERNEVLGLFAGWNSQVRALISGTEQVFKWALFDRLPLETWTRGRVTLLGDAAHPMLPFVGQGAAQSIEDGYVLGRCLAADQNDPERAINRYAALRRERAAEVQAASRAAGRMMGLSDPAEVAARNARMRDDPAGHVSSFDWLWGYDVESALTDG
jgi:salicylate hydroxylase